MAWTKTAASREQDRTRYQDPEYKRNRAVVLRRAGGRCEQCGRRARLEVDHKVPLAAGGGHELANMQAICAGPGSCHATKTARDSRQTPRKPSDPAFDNDRPNTRW